MGFLTRHRAQVAAGLVLVVVLALVFLRVAVSGTRADRGAGAGPQRPVAPVQRVPIIGGASLRSADGASLAARTRAKKGEGGLGTDDPEEAARPAGAGAGATTATAAVASHSMCFPLGATPATRARALAVPQHHAWAALRHLQRADSSVDAAAELARADAPSASRPSVAASDDVELARLLESPACRCDLRFFLVWTTSREDFLAQAAFRLRVLESVFRLHPFARVTILSDSLDLTVPGLAQLVRWGYALAIEPLDLRVRFHDTPLERWFDWVERLGWSDAPFYFSHVTDALRLVLLFRHGGVYLDFDVLVLRSLCTTRNALGRQRPPRAVYSRAGVHENVNGAVLVFDPGHGFLVRAMNRFPTFYDPITWESVGPGLLSYLTAFEAPALFLPEPASSPAPHPPGSPAALAELHEAARAAVRAGLDVGAGGAALDPPSFHRPSEFAVLRELQWSAPASMVLVFDTAAFYPLTGAELRSLPALWQARSVTDNNDGGGVGAGVANEVASEVQHLVADDAPGWNRCWAHLARADLLARSQHAQRTTRALTSTREGEQEGVGRGAGGGGGQGNGRALEARKEDEGEDEREDEKEAKVEPSKSGPRSLASAARLRDQGAPRPEAPAGDGGESAEGGDRESLDKRVNLPWGRIAARAHTFHLFGKAVAEAMRGLDANAPMARFLRCCCVLEGPWQEPARP